MADQSPVPGVSPNMFSKLSELLNSGVTVDQITSAMGSLKSPDGGSTLLDNISPLAQLVSEHINPSEESTMALPIVPQAAAAAAQQTAPEEGGFMDMFKSTPLGLALLQGGLSAASGTPLGQSFGQGLGVYQQLMAQQANQEAGKAQAQIEARKLAQTDRELDIREKGLGKDAKAAPTGVDDKIWKQALDTVMAGQEDLDAVDISEVYRTYNTLAPEGQKAYMQMDGSSMGALVDAMAANPDYASEYLNTAGTIYGDKATKRIGAAWSKRQKLDADAKTKADMEAAKKAEDDANTPGMLDQVATSISNFLPSAPAAPALGMQSPEAMAAMQQMMQPAPTSAFSQMQTPNAQAALQMMLQGK